MAGFDRTSLLTMNPGNQVIPTLAAREVRSSARVRSERRELATMAPIHAVPLSDKPRPCGAVLIVEKR